LLICSLLVSLCLVCLIYSYLFGDRYVVNAVLLRSLSFPTVFASSAICEFCDQVTNKTDTAVNHSK